MHDRQASLKSKLSAVALEPYLIHLATLALARMLFNVMFAWLMEILAPDKIQKAETLRNGMVMTSHICTGCPKNAMQTVHNGRVCDGESQSSYA